LHAHQGLLRAVHRGASEVHRGGRTLHRIEADVLVADHHPVGAAVGGWLKANLPVRRIRTEEAQVHAGVASGRGRVEHLLRPVFVVGDGEEGLVIQERTTTGVGVDVGGVRDVITVPLQPAHHVDLAVREELSRAV